MSDTKIASQPTEEGTGFGAQYALILVALLLSVQLSPIIGLLGGNAQSQIAIHFHTTQIAWFTLAGALVGTFVTPFLLKAAGIFGKRRVMIAITAFGLAGDVVAALATNYPTLLIGRGIAGFYGTSAALAYAMARDVFPRRLVGPASGFLGGGTGLVALGGPFLSGWLLDSHGFRGALWFMAIATALSLALLVACVPESPVRQEHARMDWIGGLLLGGGLTAIVYGIGEGSTWGWSSGRFFAYLGGGLAALVAFVVAEGWVSDPLFPLPLLRRRQVWTVVLATSVTAGAVYSLGIVMQLLALMPKIPTVSDGLGWSATKNAVVTSPLSIVIIIMAVLTGVLARRVDARLLLGIGAVLSVIGFVLGAHLHHTVAQFESWGVIAGIGMGVIVSIVPIMVIEAVSPQEQALGNGAQTLMQGVALVIISQLVFVVMARNGRVLQGTLFYRDSGFTNGFLLVAGFCAAGALLVLLIPKVEKLDEAVVGQAVS